MDIALPYSYDLKTLTPSVLLQHMLNGALLSQLGASQRRRGQLAPSPAARWGSFTEGEIHAEEATPALQQINREAV